MIKKILSIIVLLVTAVSCAATSPTALPEKYNLDNDLQSVKSISAARVSNWVQIDNQSFIFAANGSKFYLAVLDKPLESGIAYDKIGLVDRSLSVTAGYNKIFIKNDSGRRYYTIAKLYELTGKEQAKKIKRLLGEK